MSETVQRKGNKNMYPSGSEHPNADIVRKLYQALENGDFSAYLNLLTDDIVYHAAGHCFFAGDYHGKENLGKLAQTIYSETQGTHRVTRCQIMATATYVAVIDTWNAQRNGRTIQMDNMLVYKVVDSKIAECWEFIENIAEHDTFWA
jgi:ketosteroid isomerase-like protein